MLKVYNIISIILLISVLCIIQVSAIDNLGTFKKDTCVSLVQGCSNCTYNNISGLTLPNSTSILNNVQMTKSNTIFNYSFCQTDLIGSYVVSGFGDINGIPTSWSYTFDINPIGKTYSTAQSITYFILFALSILIFVFALYFGFMMDGKNEVDNEGNILKVNYYKYAKWGLYVIAYLSSMAINFFAWNISYAFLYFDSMSNIFSLFWRAQVVLTLPIALFSIILGLYSYINDRRINEYIKRGIAING